MGKLNWLDRCLFVSSHHFTLCTSEKMFKKALKHLKIQKPDRPPFLNNWHSDATAHYFDNRESRSKSVVVCIGSTKGYSLAQIHALLVHEAVHIWQQVKADYGESAPSYELEAYAIQNLSQRLMEEYSRQQCRSKDEK